MRIAICDDEKRIAELFGEKIQSEEKESEILIFTNGIDLINSELKFDIAFLDIEMEAMDGFRVARALKEKQPQCIYSFITTHAELAIDGYEYQPFRYILKTASDSVIKRKIRETIHEYYCRNKTIKTSYRGHHCIVRVNDILWIESKGHCMKIVTKSGEILWNKPLNEAETELEQYGLVRCHKSFIVAMGQIKEFNTKSIKMKIGNEISVGRMYRAHFLEKYKSFILSN